ncbi:hypothetical protein GCM10012284_38720 [Mangrovihabitans endophyticus]|uniref:Uncharacterized protein n=1 Tax=Mangrovihabitans endophyticus TaxID=1751298 RepID=A0A8J3C0C0_9ACTN|nr:hypothetical protein GCM10012284_38720 [Mangrovihabitans endophyticus]
MNRRSASITKRHASPSLSGLSPADLSPADLIRDGLIAGRPLNGRATDGDREREASPENCRTPVARSASWIRTVRDDG